LKCAKSRFHLNIDIGNEVIFAESKANIRTLASNDKYDENLVYKNVDQKNIFLILYSICLKK
jgi:hypothetical protein